MAFTFTFRKSADSHDEHPPFDLRQEGADYADLTSPERVQTALSEGRVERVPLVPPRFGGSMSANNLICAAPGAGRALAWVEERVYEHLQNGDHVTYRADVTYKSGSAMPAALRVDTGLEVFTLRFW